MEVYLPLEHSLLRDRDACKVLGCSRATLWRRVQDGTLRPPIKIGHMSRFVASEIHEAIEKAKSDRAGD
jgi:predicted DNA-binding transcriptional regulator AlpA